MSQASSIEWTDRTWNPVRGCTRVSPGCGGPGPHGGCYAEGIAARFSGLGQPYHGLAEMRGGKPRWTGKLAFAEGALTEPLRRREPTTWFVNSMSDLFHENMPETWVDRVFAVMALAPRHTFQILTKRSGQMRRYLSDPSAYRRVLDYARALRDTRPELGSVPISDPRHGAFWPHVWIGVSVEDQIRADERREDLALLAAAGWTTFVSYEPALGSVDWTGWEFLSWLISGGESGPKARPSHPDWHRAARDFCATHGIPYLFKQWGAWSPTLDRDRHDPDWRSDYSDKLNNRRSDVAWINLAGGCGFHGERFHVMRRLGKAAAGRILDGRTYDDMPATAADRRAFA